MSDDNDSDDESQIEEVQEEVEGRLDEVQEDVEEQLDESLEFLNDTVDDLLAEILDTRARMTVYVGLEKLGEATAEEVAEETGLYPKTVENTLQDLEDDDIVEQVGEDDWASISPTDLVRKLPDRIGGWLEDLIDRGADEDEDTGTEIPVE
jgi:predicted transcriptional regulator